MSGLRQRRQLSALKIVQELDAFPKVPDSYQETTATGGGISLLTFVLIAILVISEIQYYMASQLKYEYDIDPDFEGKLKLNIDITVAMKCSHVGADILDLTGQNAETFGHLKEEDVIFELSPRQKTFFDMVKHVNTYLRNEYHAIHEFLWNTGYNTISSSMPPRDDDTTKAPDACRFHGTLVVNKVAGNFHITAGKSVPVFPRGHAHLSFMMKESDYNFSHRIVHFSYGDPTLGIVNPLEGEEKIVTDNNHMFQYFVQVVPTLVETKFSNANTFQYAATEQNRTISHSKGSHGVPGIYFKYDLSSIRVHVREEHQPYWQFFARLCGIVGGIFATSGLLHQMVSAIVDLLCCRFKSTGNESHRGSQQWPSVASSSSTGHTNSNPCPSLHSMTSSLLDADGLTPSPEILPFGKSPLTSVNDAVFM